MSCGIPESPGNGSFTGNEFALDSKVTYECNEGFQLEAGQQAAAVCREDGLWNNTGKPPTCKRECSRAFAHLGRFNLERDSRVRTPDSKAWRPCSTACEALVACIVVIVEPIYV